MGRAESTGIGKFNFDGTLRHSLAASGALTLIDDLADFDLEGVREVTVINKTAAIVGLDFSVYGGPIYIHPGDEYTIKGALSGTIAFSGVAGTNVGTASAGIDPYIQIIAKSQ